MIDAYDPSRLKNITIKKQGLIEFISKHNPETDPLGKLYIMSILKYFNEWKKNMNKKYQEVFLEFTRENGAEKLDAIGEELTDIEAMSFHMLNQVESVLIRY